MNRRDMLLGIAGAAVGAGAAVTLESASALARADEKRADLPEPTSAHLPRWRGFNLLEMFMVANEKPFREDDFAAISELGFNFVRLPLDYRCWAEKGDWTKFREEPLKQVDDAVKLGEKHGIHVQVSFHRAPGYTVAAPPEAKSLWTDAEAQDVCALHWSRFADRYKGIANKQVSFNLFNEPAKVDPVLHKKVVERMVRAIHDKDHNRLIVCDGRDYGNTPPTELLGLDVAAATRGYAPFHLTHYHATWVQGSDKWDKPTYPIREGGALWDKARLEKQQIEPWKALESKGMGVMVGEFGSHNQTPHDVVLKWMRDCLSAWKAADWGWALWNFRGSFGIVDSGRSDVKYEDWHGRKLDRAMLELLQSA